MKRSLLFIALYLALPMVMLPTLWGNPLSAGEDDVVYYYPLRKLVAAELAQGRLPLYNAREATGMPLMADPQTAVLHPTTWLFVATDAKIAYAASLYLAFTLAGGGAFLYMRRLGLITPAAILGSIVFMFCGFMVGHRVHQSVILAACMLPWGLWVVEGLRKTQSPASGLQPPASRLLAALLLVPIVYWTITAGHWPTLIHMCLIWGVYFLFRARPIVSSGLLVAGAMAVAGLLALPQIKVTADLLASATRQKIGLAMAGENSFLPTSGVLAMFPFFQGCRTTNFFSQQWWGSWHLCEMLGYVGLLTLVLAGAVIWRGFRKRRPAAEAAAPCEVTAWNKLIRTWTFIIVGAAIFMMGYYLPTYKLINMIPGLGVVRCPARMVLAVDIGLATLAAVGVHLLLTAPASQARMQRLRKTLRTLALYVLPGAMVAALLLWAGIAALWWAMGFRDSFYWLPFEGGARQVFAALGVHIAASGATSFSPSPAVYVPLILMAITAGTVVVLLRRTQSEIPADQSADEQNRLRFRTRSMALPVAITALILVDLFFITRFVDVPAAGNQEIAPDPDQSAAGAWLKQHDPNLDSYRIYSLSQTYHTRPDELLLPKTCTAMGFTAIGNYGPFQSPYHVQMLGFRIWGQDRDWADHLRGNHLLSLYGVKYIITAEPQYRDVLDSVTVPTQVPPPDGKNVLDRQWSPERTWKTNDDPLGRWVTSTIGSLPTITGSGSDTHLTMKTPLLWWSSAAYRPVNIFHSGVYKISFDTRGPQGGAACYLSAEITHLKCVPARAWFEAEEIGPEWRHFECTMKISDAEMGPGQSRPGSFLFIHTRSERPIELKNISVQRSHFRGPINFDNKLKPGEHVYKFLKEFPARDTSQPKVAIYENLLAQPIPTGDRLMPATNENVEAIKYLPEDTMNVPAKLPDISLPPVKSPAGLIKMVTLPVAGLWVIAMVVVLLACRRRRKS